MNRVFAFGVIGLGMLCACSAKAADSDEAVTECSDASARAVNVSLVSITDTVALCDVARRKLGFTPTVTDLQLLLKAAAVARYNAGQRSFDLPVKMAGTNLLDIVLLRGLASDRDGFTRTLEVATRLGTSSKGVVSPGALLLQLNAAGPLSKTMSDDGMLGFGAMVEVDEQQKVELGSFAAQQPLFATIVGPWGISGHIVDGGILKVATCQMSRSSADGEFGYAVSLSAGAGMPMVSAMFRSPTTLPYGASPLVTVTFPGNAKFNLRGKVSGDMLLTELPSNAGALQRLLDSFQHASSMRLAVAGRGGGTMAVDLTQVAEAFEANGQCLHDSLERAVAH